MSTTEAASRQETLDRVYALAYENESKYGSCPQCVMAAIQDAMGIVDDATFKAAHAFAGGGGLSTRGTCGALVGGILALGSQYGRDRENFAKGRFIESYKLAKQLYDRFVAEYGSPICADVQTRIFGRSFEMWDPKDFQAFEAEGGHRDKCTAVAGNAARWAAEILLDTEEKGIRNIR